MSGAHEQGGLFDSPEVLPQGLVYVPGFLTLDEERALLAAIAPVALREAKFREYFAKRRVAHFHDEGDAPRYDDESADAFTSGPLPPFLTTLRDKVAAHLGLPARAFIHALVSEYRAGTPIGWHRDKPAGDQDQEDGKSKGKEHREFVQGETVVGSSKGSRRKASSRMVAGSLAKANSPT